jgi:cob(I)alamin adenosyltransferase
MNIYTKTGDKGSTSLIGGKRVPKYHDRIEAYGTVDELISYIGYLRDQLQEKKIKEELLFIQDRLMTSASILAFDGEEDEIKIPELFEDDVLRLEKSIDEMDEELPELTSFILPGGHPVVSFTHISRNVCRKAERYSLKLYQEYKFSELLLKFLNRLSDYLFVLARKLGKDYNAEEILWIPKA